MIMMLSLILCSKSLDKWVPSRFFLQIYHAGKAKIKQDKQPDRLSHVNWPVPRESKALWKNTTKIKDALMQIWNFTVCSVSHKNNTLKV